MQERNHSKDRQPHHPASGVVRVGPLMGIPEVLHELGREPGPVLESAGFHPAQFTDPDTEVSYVPASRLLARCVAVTGCEHFGLLVGERAGSSSLGVTGFLLRSAPDVGTALRDLVQYLDLHDQGGVPMLQLRGEVSLLGYAIHQAGVVASDQIYDLSIAVACNILRGLCGGNWNPDEVLLSRRQPRQLAPYRRFFRAPLRFNADQSAVVFASRWLEHKVPGADALLHRHLEKQANELHHLRHTGVVVELRSLLRRALLNGECTVSGIARQLCLHERTLHRRLREQGTSFRQELGDIRREMARQLLAGTAMPVAKIATTLNYADASAFNRAFKRWTGVTPVQWRTRGDPHAGSRRPEAIRPDIT